MQFFFLFFLSGPLPLQVLANDASLSRIGVFLLILLCRRAVLTFASPCDRRYPSTYWCFSLNFTMQTGRLFPLQVLTIGATVPLIGVFFLILLCRRAVFPLQAPLPIYPLTGTGAGIFLFIPTRSVEIFASFRPRSKFFALAFLGCTADKTQPSRWPQHPVRLYIGKTAKM